MLYHIISMLILLLLIPLIGIFFISATSSPSIVSGPSSLSITNNTSKQIKLIGLSTTILNFFVSLVFFLFYHFSTNQYQFVQEYYQINYFDIYLGVDGLSIYFVLLTTIIIPISLLSN